MNIEATRLTSLFHSIAGAVAEGEIAAALSLAESARRFAPSNPTAILLHSRLLLNSGAADSAMECLRGRPEPDSMVVHADAARAAGAVDEAGGSCRSLLSRFALDFVDGLASTASRLAHAHGDRFPGWVGIDSSLRLVGEIPPNCVINLEHDGAYLEPIETQGEAGSLVAFSVAPTAGRVGPLHVRMGDIDLLGSGLCWPPNFGMVGWVVLEDRSLVGEISLEWAPACGISLVFSQGSRNHHARVEPVIRGDVGWVFSVPFEELCVDGADVHVFAVLPDGQLAPLTGSPLSTLKVLPRSIGKTSVEYSVPPSMIGRNALRPSVNVVVPVYSGLQETLDCLHSVLATTDEATVTITVVDDAVPDATLRAALDELAGGSRVTLIRNPENLGFPGAANRGMRLHRDRDVVVLNSDTQVFEGWLERLADVAYSADDVGSVTPFGEAASIVTYCASAEVRHSSVEAREIDRLASRVNRGRSIEIPVGVGFCLYLRRSCLDQIGEFDEQSFGKGYGEENDYCLRASNSGWRHLAATDVFVRHTGGRSYGAAKRALTVRNSRVLNRLYPGYDDFIAGFIARDPLRSARRAIDRQRLLNLASRSVLLLSFDLAGGVRRHVEQRQTVLEAMGHTVLVLRAGSPDLPDSVRVTVVGADFGNLLYDVSRDLSELRTLLLDLSLLQIELHHFLGLSDSVLTMVAALGVPYRLLIHDYAWICPRVSLLNGDGVYCGEPAIDSCEVCVKKHGSVFADPPTVKELRERTGLLLGGARQVVAPSHDVRERLRRYYPQARIDVIPWQLSAPENRLRAVRRNGRVRAVLVGAIGTPKGYSVLLECARDAAHRGLPLEFIVVGYTRDDSALLATGRVTITGPYQEHEAAALLEREDCDIALFPSQAPETWCYSLTYALTANLPVVAFDLGAVAERLRAAGSGVLLPLSTPPTAVNDALLQYAVPEDKSVHAKSRSVELTTQSTDSPGLDSHPGELSASVQVITLPIGIYAFTVKGGSTAPADGLAVPAFHVGTAPVRSEGVIQFLEGPDTLDRWLTRSGDVIMVKIYRGSATLLLTSLRASDSDVLAIDVRRLDVAELPTLPAETDLPDSAPEPNETGPKPVIVAHVQNLGDLEFKEEWAGRIEEGLWIEAYSATVDTPADADLLEYCGVSYLGEETAWLSGGSVCGSRGEGVPLVAFAIRTKGTADYLTCAYSGRFLSGSVVGPFSDGRLCRSELLGDPLVGIELRLVQQKPGTPDDG